MPPFLVVRHNDAAHPSFYAGTPAPYTRAQWTIDPVSAVRFADDRHADSVAFMHSGAEVVDVRRPVFIEWEDERGNQNTAVVGVDIAELEDTITIRLRKVSRNFCRDLLLAELMTFCHATINVHAGQGRYYHVYYLP